jgi:protein translocase SecG subunit
MNNTISIIQIIISVLLVTVIILQDRGTGAGVVFGGGDQVYRAKRGPEKTLHYITVTLGVMLFALGIYSLVF